MTEQEAVEYWKEQKYIGRNAPNDYCNAVDCAIKALEEISLYKQGGLCLIPTDVFGRQCEELDNYKELGTVEELRVARDKQVGKKPKYQKIEYGKHKWKRKRNGEIDDFAWDFQYCNGVVCEVCGDTYCVHCNPDYDDLEDCVMEYWFCPNCNEKVGYTFSHCARCNQKLDWIDEDE